MDLRQLLLHSDILAQTNKGTERPLLCVVVPARNPRTPEVKAGVQLQASFRNIELEASIHTAMSYSTITNRKLKPPPKQHQQKTEKSQPSQPPH